jgi:excisionase family DNA binding protein
MPQRSNYQELPDTTHSAKEDLPAVTPVYVSIKELAGLSGLSESTLRRLYQRGRIQALQPGGPGTRLLFRRDALEHTQDLPVDSRATMSSESPIRLPGPTPRWIENSSTNYPKEN